MSEEPAPLQAAAERALSAGLRSVHMVAWRDLDDPEAGGSELHAHKVASLWASAGIDVTLRTSGAPGRRGVVDRSGYRVIRKSGRYGVFPRSALSGLVGRRGRPDGLVEIWNGMPFLSPLWAHCARICFVHHVHAEMWDMVLPPRLARAGRVLEQRFAPPFYRRTRVVTLSESSREEIVSMLRIPSQNVEVVAPGVDPLFSPSPALRSKEPLVLAVGRLVPVKRYDLLIDTLTRVADRVPGLRAVIVGEGFERPALEAKIAEAGAQRWIELAGRCEDEDLLDLYRKAWVLVSASQREGWGMSITEAGACGTPSIVTRIAGHVDAVEDGVGGLVVDLPPRSGPPGAGTEQLADAISQVLSDDALRARLAAGALKFAERLTWEATAARVLELLAAEAARRHRVTRPFAL